MSRISRTGIAGSAGALACGALLFLVITAYEPRPVDVRRVDLSPVQPGVLSATHTTVLKPVQSTTTTVVAAPPPRLEVPVATTAEPTATTTTTVETPPATTTAPPSTPPSRQRPHRPHRCDNAYVTDGVCVPWLFPPGLFPPGLGRACEWLRDQGVTRIEVRGHDRHRLDRDRDGLACEVPDDQPRHHRPTRQRPKADPRTAPPATADTAPPTAGPRSPRPS
ncbi:hypothetical protein [Saccharothrix australiensis]|uniref:Excalibur calcium-binding domain-containing protein n=1 Tax=Saccharothrix australiensis TaxID=2072 RepID=A0A495WA30_9PSEU|nr:hypothetical protein [Saccharothrix australiensis]RKT57980.1 hypothetical protein C8E97_6715 [Saccharothrix australiensis]